MYLPRSNHGFGGNGASLSYIRRSHQCFCFSRAAIRKAKPSAFRKKRFMLEKIEIHLLSKLMGMNHALWSHRFGGRLIESMSHDVDNMNT